MSGRRVAVGSTLDDRSLDHAVRTLRDAGQEVVLLGGRQTPQQLAHAAVAEDAAWLVVAGEPEHLDEVRQVLTGLDAADIEVTPVDAGATGPRSPR